MTETRPDRREPLGNLARDRARLRPAATMRLIPILGAALAVAACAPSPADAQSSTPGRVAAAQQACAGAMHLDPSGMDHEVCVDSLLQTLGEMDQARLVQSDRLACMNRGLQPGTRDFAICVVDREQPADNN